ncbi:MAG: histidinol dehydrogenase [Rhodospirillaceae bacterium]|nr:histidinol dehydrogenase [Rhodospirillaceae bacterium]
MPKLLDTQSSGFADEFTNFLDGKRETARDVNDVVAGILNDVRSRGDAALIEATQKFDKFDLTPQTMAFSPKDIAAARDDCERGTLDALELAAQRIEDFHQRQIPDDLDHTDADGVRLGYRWTAVGAAGLYVPGGTAAYPSSVLMNAIPAKVAGVDRLVMVVPTPNGVVNQLVLAAAGIAGIDTIYRIGGAQAVGALAYGTETISPVDKIVGPGNAYVAAAKRQVYGTVGIDMIAGPSEILVLADGENDPAWIAADLLSQAEHDLAAQAILMTDDRAFADAVVAAVDGHLKTLPRADTAGESWRNYGAVIIVPEIADALPLIDRIAPEHLEIATEDARALAMQVRNAGAIFMGRFVPEALGDYLAGPNHVLPTARSARFSSGLGVLDFMKRTSMIECSSEGLNAIGPAAVTLARAEGLDAHALSVSIRLNKPARS